MRGGITVLFLEGAGKIFLIGKSAGYGNFLHRKPTLRQKLQRPIHAKPSQILLGGDPKAGPERPLQPRCADEKTIAYRLHVQRGILKPGLHIANTIRKHRVFHDELLVAFQRFQNFIHGGNVDAL